MPLFFTLLKAATKRTGAWDAPPPNRLEEIKRIFKAFFFAMLLFFTLLKAALKRTAKKCPNARKGAFLQGEQMPNRNNTNAPQNISFRRFCTAVT